MLKYCILILLNLALIINCIACSPTSENSQNFDITSAKDNWKVFQGEDVAISLPQNFEGGNPTNTKELKKISEKLNSLPCITSKTTEKLEQNVKGILLMAFLPKCDSNNLSIGVNIIKEEISNEETLDKYLENEINNLKEKYKIIEKRIFDINQESIASILAEIQLENITMKQLFYIINKEDEFWIITYSIKADKFEENLSIFEDSIKTIQFLN